MAAQKVKVFRTTLKHGNTYMAGPYHFQLGRPVDIVERDAAIAQHLMKHPSFTVIETFVEVKGDDVMEANLAVAAAIKEADAEAEAEGDVEENEGDEGGETATTHPAITEAPKAQVRRIPKK